MQQINKSQRTELQQARIDEFKANQISRRFGSSAIYKVLLKESCQNSLMKFIKNPKNFLFIQGNPGIGKTYVCAALLDYFYEKFEGKRYWTESNLLKKVRSSMDLRGDYLESLELLIDDQFLIIDDLGSQSDNEFREDVIFHMLDYRYGLQLPTVITTNLSREELKERYNHRILSRLYASENCIISMHNGEDLRQHGK